MKGGAGTDQKNVKEGKKRRKQIFSHLIFGVGGKKKGRTL